MTMMTKLRAMLRLHEDERLKPYRCTAGKLTIGVGRNLDDVGITREESDFLLSNDIKRVEAELDATFPWAKSLDEVRRAVMLDMLFNLGLGRYRGFRKHLAALQRGDFQAAATEMIDSLWYRQVKSRGVRLVNMIRTGQWPNDVPA